MLANSWSISPHITLAISKGIAIGYWTFFPLLTLFIGLIEIQFLFLALKLPNFVHVSSLNICAIRSLLFMLVVLITTRFAKSLNFFQFLFFFARLNRLRPKLLRRSTSEKFCFVYRCVG